MKGTDYRDQNTKDTNTEYRLKINNNKINNNQKYGATERLVKF